MKVAFVSDLHVDFSQPKIHWGDVRADVLVIAGDVANNIGEELKVYRRAAKFFPHVVITDGNHLHYSNANQKRTVEDTIASLAKQLPDNVHMLGHHKPRIELDGVHFVGCNGWYSFDVDGGDPIANRVRWMEEMNDCRNIGFDKIEQMPVWDRAVADAELVHKALTEIRDEDAALTVPKPIVVLTHTAPHRDMVAWKDDLSWNRSNAFYVNSHMQKVLESPVGQQVTIWANGHTHHPKDMQVGRVYCICNPRGYPGQNPRWAPAVIPIIK